MAKAAPLRSANKKLLVASLLAAACLAGCARQAPDIPTDLGALPPAKRLSAEDATSPQAAMNCAALDGALSRNKKEAAALEANIESHRGRNQAAVYVTAVAVPVLSPVVAEHSIAEKERLNLLQRERDRLFRIADAKSCARRS